MEGITVDAESLPVEDKTNAEREKKQRHAPRRHILAVERTEENFVGVRKPCSVGLHVPALF